MRLVSKHSQVGYQTPGDRPGCRNCKHFDQVRHDSPVMAPRQACLKHELEVTSGGICNDYKPDGKTRLDGRPVQRDLLENIVVDLLRVPQGGEMRS